MELGEVLRELRDSRGLTRKQVAELLDRHPATIENWEGGKTSPTVDDLAAVCAVYGTSVARVVDEVFSGNVTVVEARRRSRPGPQGAAVCDFDALHRFLRCPTRAEVLRTMPRHVYQLGRDKLLVVDLLFEIGDGTRVIDDAERRTLSREVEAHIQALAEGRTRRGH